MSAFASLSLESKDSWLLQGWNPPQADELTAAFAASGGLGMLRLPALPDPASIDQRLEALRAKAEGWVGLDVRGILEPVEPLLKGLRQKQVSFLAYGRQMSQDLRARLSNLDMPRLAFVSTEQDALTAAREGARALVLEEGPGFWDRLRAIRSAVSLPLLAPEKAQSAYAHEELQGVHVQGPHFFRGSELQNQWTGLFGQTWAEADRAPLPSLRIRHLELPYPILQGGMGVGVSWAKLAGNVARNGCVGLVSAIGTGFLDPSSITLRRGQPDGPDNLNDGACLTRILHEAQEIAGNRGAIGVNILCAIQGYDQVVRNAVVAGAQLIVSGAGLPLGLPGLVGDAEVALVPIVSSGRALRLICKTWKQRYGRLPDAVVLEGPESGGHQGFSLEQCVDPAYSLENLLPDVLKERDQWGDFPVIVAGGIWDHADIRKFLALGASGVQIATRFIGTFECDASLAFKEILLRAKQEDIQLMKSPVGLPARGVVTELQRRIERGEAPPIACIGHCVAPCQNGAGARKAGFCIAERLEDARQGKRDTGLFFSGSNGWRLDSLLPVRDLIAELTQDYGLTRLEEA